ncbi:MAG: CpXC domain-containing protein [Clostridia bacterium]|jgi:rRNA maturation protein Nop10|nr:CpXC domain-containing protein [Clostridia bacterium]
MENKKYTIKCPECGTDVEVSRPAVINVQNDPEYKIKVLTGELFNEKCPKCGQGLQVVSRITYHDMDKRLMIYFRPITSQDELKTFDYEAIRSAIEDNFKAPNYAIRVVTTVNELMEKIKIAEFGLNDGVIEIAKFVYFDIFTKQFDGVGVVNIYYERRDDKDALIFFCNDGKTRSILIAPEVYSSIEKRFSAVVNAIYTSRVCMVGRDWALRMIKAYSKLDSENNGETPDLKPELKLLESEN